MKNTAHWFKKARHADSATALRPNHLGHWPWLAAQSGRLTAPTGICAVQMPIMCKYDVIDKTGSTQRITTPAEDRATAIGNMHKIFVKIGRAVAEICLWADKPTQTYRRTQYSIPIRDSNGFDSIRYANRFQSIRFVKNRPFDSLVVMQFFLLNYCIVSAKKISWRHCLWRLIL